METGNRLRLAATDDTPEEARMGAEHPPGPGEVTGGTPNPFTKEGEFLWDADAPLADLCAALGRRLAEAGDLYRDAGSGAGLLLVPAAPHEYPRRIDSARPLASVVVDRIDVCYIKRGLLKGRSIPMGHLSTARAARHFWGSSRQWTG
jgi:hypothetical protein